jgi:hypothetical protein
MKTLNGKEAIRFGWKATTSNFWFFLGLMAIFFIANFIIPNIIAQIFSWTEDSPLPVTIVVRLINTIVSTYVGLVFVAVSLRVVDGKPLVYEDVVGVKSLFIPYLITTIIFQVAVAIGTILLIVPGFMMAIAGMFYPNLVVDKKLKFWPAIQESMRITKGYRWQLFTTGLVLVLINLAGILALGFGLLWTIPTTTVAFAHMYRQLV